MHLRLEQQPFIAHTHCEQFGRPILEPRRTHSIRHPLITLLAVIAELAGAPAASGCKSPSGSSPERISASDYSYEADVWGLGISLWECAVGRYPHGPSSVTGGSRPGSGWRSRNTSRGWASCGSGTSTPACACGPSRRSTTPSAGSFPMEQRRNSSSKLTI